MSGILQLISWLVWCVPAYVDDFVVLVGIVDRHGHVVIRCNNLLQWSACARNIANSMQIHLFKVLAEPLLEELCVVLEQREKQLVKAYY